MPLYAPLRGYPSHALSGGDPIERLIRGWLARKAVMEMEELDDSPLWDIGATRADVIWASNLPLTRNAALALQERQLMAKAKRHAG